MILSFKRTYPWGDPTFFMQKIAGQWCVPGHKAHTFRMGDRWKPGDKIHFWSENPRNVSMNPMEFNLEDPRSAVYWCDVQRDQVIHRDLMPRYYHDWPANHENYVPLVYAVEEFHIQMERVEAGNTIFKISIGDYFSWSMSINVTFSYTSKDFDEKFKWMTYRDGFENPYDFIRWFWTYKPPHQDVELSGQVIHWDDKCIYDPHNANFFTPINQQS